MTISSESRKAGPFTGNGVTTSFPFTFKVFEDSDLRVVRTTPTGAETDLVLDSDYSVTLNPDQNATPGGTITYPLSGDPLPASWMLTAVGNIQALQETDLTNQGGFYPQVIEDALDRATILIQQAEEQAGRTLRLPVSDDGEGIELPGAAARAGKVLGFDASGVPQLVEVVEGSEVAIVNRQKFTATAAQTDFTTSFSFTPGVNAVSVFLNGSKLVITDDYLELDDNMIRLNTGAAVSDTVEVVSAGLAAGNQAAIEALAQAAQDAADRVDLGALDQAVEDSEAARDAALVQADRAESEADRAESEADAAAADRIQTGLDAAATDADRIAAESARDAALLSRGVFASTADALSKGVASLASLVGGSGGTNGTFDLAFSGGAGTGAAGRFVVAGGAVVSTVITATGRGYTSAPTVSFAASSGLTGASATAVIANNADVGEYFSVPVTASSDALILYRVDAGPVATELTRYPSASSVLSRTRAVGMIAPFAANDLASDPSSPLFLNAYEFIQSSNTPASFAEATIVSRDSDTQFTVSAGHGNRFTAGSAFIVLDDASGLHKRYTCLSVSTDVITTHVGQVLPASISVAQTMHDATLGQHLSRFGYLAYGEYVADLIERYAYKKNEPITAFNAAICNTTSFNTYNINNFANTKVLFPVTRLGTASGGGLVSGTDLVKLCQISDADRNFGDTIPGVYVSRRYEISDLNAGSGISLTFDTFGHAGFIEVPLTAARRAYNTTLRTTGRARLEILADGVSIHDQIYNIGLLHIARVNFPSTQALTLRFTLADSVVSVLSLYGAFVYAKSNDTPASIPWRDDVVIAALGDSWFEFPPKITGETFPLRADGSTADGMQFLTTRLKSRLTEKGIRSTVLNMARGGQTSEWARYWVKEIVKLSPKPTHCLLHFSINDSNSSGNFAGRTPSVYDFSPTNMWAAQLSNAGGVFGSVNGARWFENMRWICEYLGKNGIQPIVFMPPITASAGQSQGLQQQYLNRIAAGFDPIYAESGRT